MRGRATDKLKVFTFIETKSESIIYIKRNESELKFDAFSRNNNLHHISTDKDDCIA